MSIDYTTSSSNSDNEENLLSVDSIEISLGSPIPISIKPLEYLISSIKLLKIPSYKKAQLITIVQNRDIQKTYVSLFWLVFCKKLRNDSTRVVQQYLSEKLTKKYVKLTLNKLQTKSNDVYDFLPLILSYGVHHQMWDIFAGSRKIFNIRFVYDCYQIVLLELLGTPVTDLFVKNYTEKAFGSNFLKYNYTKEKIDPSKLGPPIHIQEKASKIEGGKELVYEIYTKLRQNSYRSGNISRRSTTPDIKLNGGDVALQKVVNSHITKSPNGAAFAEKVQENKFNCVSLSPLLSRHLQIPSVKYI
jgi:hypothetical protein